MHVKVINNDWLNNVFNSWHGVLTYDVISRFIQFLFCSKRKQKAEKTRNRLQQLLSFQIVSKFEINNPICLRYRNRKEIPRWSLCLLWPLKSVLGSYINTVVTQFRVRYTGRWKSRYRIYSMVYYVFPLIIVTISNNHVLHS